MESKLLFTGQSGIGLDATISLVYPDTALQVPFISFCVTALRRFSVNDHEIQLFELRGKDDSVFWVVEDKDAEQIFLLRIAYEAEQENQSRLAFLDEGGVDFSVDGKNHFYPSWSGNLLCQESDVDAKGDVSTPKPVLYHFFKRTMSDGESEYLLAKVIHEKHLTFAVGLEINKSQIKT